MIPPVKAPRRKPSACRHLTEDEESRVTAVTAAGTGAYHLRDACYYIACKRTGYRVSEMLSWTVGMVLIGGTIAKAIHVDKDKMKGKRDRKPVPLHPEAQQAIAAWLVDLKALCGGMLDPACPLFLSRKHNKDGSRRAISRQQAYRVMTVFYDKAGLVRNDGKALANHTLRKTFAMRIYNGTNHNIFLTSKALGHSSISITQIYLGISDEEVADAILNAASGIIYYGYSEDSMDRPRTRPGFVQCLACGNARMVLLGVEEDQGPPAYVWIGALCLECTHVTTISISQAPEQVCVGWFLRKCPDTCTEQAAHKKL